MSVPSQSKRTPSMLRFRFAAIISQGSRNFVYVAPCKVGERWQERPWESDWNGTGARNLRFQKTGRNAIVAVKLDIIEGCGDAIPARHISGLCAAHLRHRSNHHVSEAQGLAYQHDLKLDRGANRQMDGAEKIDAGGADVASDQRNRKFLGHSARAPKAQRQIQCGAGVLPMFGMHANGVRWHADETARQRGDQERRQPQGRNARRIRKWLRSQHSFASFSGWFGRPGFKWNCALRRAHLALGDDTSLSPATAQLTELPN